jgi:hypothetical protein
VSEHAAWLAAIRADLPKIRKSTRGQHGKYANYPTIKAMVDPVLAKHESVWWTQPTRAADGSFVLAYQLEQIHGPLVVAGEFPLQVMDPQKQGSQISYAKRYALCAVLDIAPEGEDDDGMAASGQRQRTPAKVTGPEHERLRYGTVEPTPEDRPAERVRAGDNPPVDMWMDQPSGPFDIGRPEDHPGSIDRAQERVMHREFNRLGITDRSVRLGMTADIIGRQVMTSQQLSRLEAEHLIKALKAREPGQ